MIHFIFLGGLIAIPLIYLSKRPLFSNQSLPNSQQEMKKDEEVTKEETPELTPEQIEEMKERTKKRQEKVLEALSPEEREMFLKYISDIKEDRKNPKDTFYRFVDFCMLILLLGAALIVIWFLSKTATKTKSIHTDL